MGLFKKKERIPEIPSASILPDLPSIEQTERKNLPELPSFPSDSKNNNINQNMIKSAITDIPSLGENEVHVEIPKGLRVKEERKRGNIIPSQPSIENAIPELPTKSFVVPERTPPALPQQLSRPINRQTPANDHSQNSNEPIFIRIDKFQSAQKNFEQIKEKVSKIETVLGKIKDIKSKEEIELKGWTEDVEKIKMRLSEIDADIFDQI